MVHAAVDLLRGVGVQRHADVVHGAARPRLDRCAALHDSSRQAHTRAGYRAEVDAGQQWRAGRHLHGAAADNARG